MTTIELTEKVMAANSAIYCYVEKGLIKGNYRGKKSTSFCFDPKTLQFNYNYAGAVVSSAFEAFVNDAKKANEVRRLLNEDIEE